MGVRVGRGVALGPLESVGVDCGVEVRAELSFVGTSVGAAVSDGEAKTASVAGGIVEVGTTTLDTPAWRSLARTASCCAT